MKVNMNQNLDKKPESKKSKVKTKSPAPVKDTSDSGNVYAESLKMYKDKWKKQGFGNGIFRKNKFWIGLIVVLFFVFISVNSNATSTKTQLTVKLKRMTTETSNLNTAIEKVKADLEEQARIDAIKMTEEEEELAMNDAKVQGARVADLQNRYRKYDVGDQEFSDIKKSLAACFGKDAEKGQTEWYIITKNEDGKWNGIPGTWEFVSNASFKGTISDVLWLCYADDDHSLLAYCTAKYDATTKLFTKVNWKMTRYAASNIGTDEDIANAGHISSIMDSFDDLIDQGIGGNTPSADKDFDEETINNNNDAYNTRSDYENAVSHGEVKGEEYNPNYNIGLNNSDEQKSEIESEIESETETESESKSEQKSESSSNAE